MFAPEKLGVLLIVGAIAVTGASAQRRWPKDDHRSDSPRAATQQPQTPQSDRAQSNRPAQSSPGIIFGGGRHQPERNKPDSSSSNPRNGDWLRNHSNLPPQEQQRALENDPAFRALPPQQQDRLRDRLQKFNSEPPDRRERMLQRLDTWNRLTPDQRERAKSLFQRFRGVPEDRRKSMVFALRNLRNLSPEDRQRVMDSQQFRDSFSDDERNILRGMTDLNIGPGHHDSSEGGPPE